MFCYAATLIACCLALAPPQDCEPLHAPHRDLDAAALEGALQLVHGHLVELLGPPPGGLHLLLDGSSAGGFDVRVAGESEALLHGLGDLSEPAAYRLAFALVPRWYGLDPSHWTRYSGPESWFPWALREFAARTAADLFGSVGRPPGWGFENAWLRVDLLRLHLLEQPHPRERDNVSWVALAGAAYLQAFEVQVGLRPLLEGYDGRGYPRPADPALARAWRLFRGRHIVARQPLPFEKEWSLELRRADRVQRGGVRAWLTLVFQAGLEGSLEDCGCEARPGGGMEERTQALRRLRALYPGLVALDLGRFLNPVPDPDVRAQPGGARAFARRMLDALRALDLDGVAVAAGDWIAGVEALAPDGLPLVAAGTEAFGRRPYRAHRAFVRGGQRVVFVGYNERTELPGAYYHDAATLAGLRLPTGVDELAAQLPALAEEADLLIVGGHMGPASARALCAPELGVDVLLLAGYERYPTLAGEQPAFLGDTLVARDLCGKFGLNRLTLLRDADGDLVGGVQAAVRLEPQLVSNEGPLPERAK